MKRDVDLLGVWGLGFSARGVGLRVWGGVGLRVLGHEGAGLGCQSRFVVHVSSNDGPGNERAGTKTASRRKTESRRKTASRQD